MNRLLPFLLIFLFGGIWCDIPLSSEENQYWKANCGTKPYHPRRFESRRIAGGQPIQGYAAPWAVRIDKIMGSNTGMCSGTIISPRHILTASHCLMPDKSKMTPTLQQTNQRCYDYDWILYPDSSWFNIYNSYWKLLSNKVSRIVMMNYCYQATCDYDDMMILELNENIQLDDYAYPACVSSNPNFQAINTRVIVTSYGHNNWDFNNTDTSGTVMLRSGVFQVTGSYNDGRFIWISGEGVNVRPGDSGGSDIHYDNGRYYLVGVNSVSFDTGFNAGASSVFAHFNKICRYTGVC